MSGISVKIGSTVAESAYTAVHELAGQIAQPDACAVIFFASSRYDLDVLGPLIDDAFACAVIGCTTAGEMASGKGYQSGSIVAASIASEQLELVPRLISPASGFGITESGMLADDIKHTLGVTAFNPQDMFGLLLIDGMAMVEERVLSFLGHAFSNLPIVGGSAGDDLRFRETLIYHDGAFYADAALLTVFRTSLPFTLFHTQHFDCTTSRLHITRADPTSRTVQQINGRPAAEAYAEALGISPVELTLDIFSTHPLILRVGGRNYIRSPRGVNADGSLMFNCAIEEGMRLYLGVARDLVADLEQTVASLQEKVANPKLMIGCECIHRRLEAEQKNLSESVRSVLEALPYVGFHTYGEQVDELHVNQTFTGILLGDE